MKTCSLLFLVLAMLSPISTAGAAVTKKPYDLTVWADVVYDETGSPSRINFPDEGLYPKKFIQSLQLKLATRRIEPRLENKLPAIFETGVSIQLTIDPAEIGAEVKINKIEELPRTINMSVAKFPADLLRAGWSGEMKVRCMVGVTGLCTDMEVLDAKALPKSARQFGLDSMKAWRFLPQRLNGKPIEYEMVIPITMTSDTPSDSRHVDRMNRRP